jgi:hypothetical protein
VTPSACESSTPSPTSLAWPFATVAVLDDRLVAAQVERQHWRAGAVWRRE